MSGPGASDVSIRAAVAAAAREHYGRLLALLVHQFGDLQLGEDALQDATLAALRHWPDGGIPDNPAAWLLQTARHRAIDRIRRARTDADKRALLAAEDTPEPPTDERVDDERIPDERLRLIFTCCHPALAADAQVALTLKTLGGLTTAQVARAFVVAEPTMAQRLLRAKNKIRAAGIPYEVPPPAILGERLAAVLRVVYFIFNEGYQASGGDAAIEIDLCDEALRLGRILLQLMPTETEVAGLLALMLLHRSRFAARTGAGGEIVDLEHQDRSRWDRDTIAAADRLLKAALMKGSAGAYQIQAAISAVHAHAVDFAATDWPQIVLLYRRLAAIGNNPVVDLNLAIALSYAEDPQTGLAWLEQRGLDRQLENYQPYYAARANLLRRAGRRREAGEMYRAAIERCDNRAQVEYLERRLAELEAN